MINYVKKAGLFLMLISLCQVSFGQQKRPLNHSDYDGWERMSSQSITKNGKWVGFGVSPQDGDSRIEIFSYQNPDKRRVIPRGERLSFSADNEFAIGTIVPAKDSLYVLKLKKTKKDDMPKDSLFIYEMAKDKLTKLARVKSYATPREAGSWIAVLYEKEKASKGKSKNGDQADSTAKAEKPKKTDGTLLEVRKLDGSVTYNFDRVKSYSFSSEGNFLQYVLAEEDTLKNTAIYLLDLKSGESKLISEGMTSYTNVTFSPKEKYLTYLATADSAKSKKPFYSLYLTPTKAVKAEKIVSETTAGILEGGRVSEHGNLRFSEDEKKLFFGVAEGYKEYAYESDTTILDEDRVSLDIWGWQDDEIQPMQLKGKSREERSSYLAVVDLSTNKVTQLADQELKDVSLPSKIEHDIAIASSDSKYRKNYSWDIQIGRDIYLINLKDGSKTLIEENASGRPSISPEAKYLYWYAGSDSSWVAYDIAAKKKINLTAGLSVPFYQELHDSPSLPGSYGTAGWLEKDAAIIIYDRFDLWQIDPKNPSQAKNLTRGEGRKSSQVYRRQTIDRDEKSINPSKELLLSAFNEETKDAGYYIGDIKGEKAPQKIIMTPHAYSRLTKAENSDEIIINRSTYSENPDLYLGDLSFKSLQKVSNLNPQQANVNWGTVELVSFMTDDGETLQGMLYKPENFDASKKYPMMVYFYERSSDGIHNYRAPAPSASTINIPYFVSNDYLVFVPDIKYKLGLPGPSAYSSIVPGVQSIVARGFVDADNMAIQGQSWGGYQVAYLITQTNMFKAAGSGAPVVNMTSAYGGIRWGTGMSRMFQYEQTQSRIGGTLWEKPLYYLENSPLFYMDRVETPVLIMHNDEDGAVPWYQGIEMFMALKRLNKPAWLLQYNGEDHNLVKRKNRKDLSVRLSQFFDHYLKGEPAPLWMTEGLPAVEKGRTLKYELESQGN